MFGWKTFAFDGNDAMWALNGYGDHLEELNPGNRERMASFGAPPGFEDVIATFFPLGDDQPGTPAHWGVTFGDGRRRTRSPRARRSSAASLVVPPMDAPWVRMTVIRDPQGATFVASQFVPENANVTPGPGRGQ